MSGGATVLRNASWLIAQSLLMGPLAIVVTALVARYLGPTQYGVLALMLATNAIFLTLGTLGLRSYGVREIAAQRIPARDLVGEMLALRMGLMLAGGLLALLVFHLMAPGAGPAMIAILAATLMGNTMALCFVDGLYGVERFKGVAAVMATSAVAVQGASMVAVFADWGLEGVGLSYAVGGAVMAVAGLVTFRRAVGMPRLVPPSTRMFEHLRKSSTFFLQNATLIIQHRADLMVVSALAGAHQAGIYGSSVTMIQKTDLLHDGLTTALFPRVADLHARDKDEMRKLVRGAMRVALLLSLPIAVGLAGLSRKLILLIFGPSFEDGAIVFAVLAAGVPFRFVYYVFFNVLGAMGWQAIVLRHTAIVVALMFAVMAPVTMRHGALGAAVVLVSSIAIVCVSMSIAYAREHGALLSLRDAAALLVANLALAAEVWFTADLGVGWQILFGVLVYSGLSVALGLVDLKLLRSVLPGGKPADVKPDA